MGPNTQTTEEPNAALGTRPRVLVLCDGDALRTSLTQAFGPGYAEIDPTSLAVRLADDRDWAVSSVTIYLSSDTVGTDEDERRWSDHLKTMPARLTIQPGDVRIRMALDATRALRLRQTDVVMVMGADASFMALAQDTRTAAREQNRDIRFASALAPSTDTDGKAAPSADLAVRIDRTIADKESSAGIRHNPAPGLRRQAFTCAGDHTGKRTPCHTPTAQARATRTPDHKSGVRCRIYRKHAGAHLAGSCGEPVVQWILPPAGLRSLALEHINDTSSWQ